MSWEDIAVARCTVERLIRRWGCRVCQEAAVQNHGARRVGDRPTDLVERDFTAGRPNQLWVSDLTCVATWRGFVYVAFVIDVFSRPASSPRSEAAATPTTTRWPSP
jgi:putative transposase